MTKANDVKVKTEIEEEKEQIELAWNGAKIVSLGGKVTAEELNAELTSNGIAGATVATGTGILTVTMPSGNKYIVEEDGTIRDEIEKAKIYAIAENTEMGVIANSNNPTTITEGGTAYLSFETDFGLRSGFWDSQCSRC